MKDIELLMDNLSKQNTSWSMNYSDSVYSIMVFLKDGRIKDFNGPNLYNVLLEAINETVG